MGLRELAIEKEYRTSSSNIVRDFYLPILKEAKLYQRAVGFFSSSALIQILDGINSIIRNGGRIELIVSPKLSEADIEAIIKGYKDRESVITKSIVEIIDEIENQNDKKRISILSILIKERKLDIKVAFLSRKKQIGMFHEKLGILTDEKGDYISFSGSMNESQTSYSYNVECIDVYRSWISEDEGRAKLKKEAFARMWNNLEDGISTIEFPKVAIQKLDIMAENFGNDKSLLQIEEDDSWNYNDHDEKIPSNWPLVPRELDIRDYQQAAVDNWNLNLCKGIFDMATGTGKTITGLLALTHLANKQGRLAVVIVAPYTHLVEQWAKELKWFNIVPIIGYSNQEYRNYRDILKREIENFNLDLSKFLCFITTNASFGTENVKKILRKLDEDSLIIVDEAHNFGSRRLYFSLPDNFSYRLALSATLDRHNDPEGTKLLYNYFGSKSIEYTLEKAIKEDKLSTYKYYPLAVVLTDDEFDNYVEITKEIGRNIFKNKNGKTIITEKAKMLMLKRARLIASASSKIGKLLDVIGKYRDENGILIYCGATNMIDDDLDESEIRQIDLISRKVYEQYKLKTSQFTSREDKLTREKIIEMFVDKRLQGIVAIKCLDEGVNIPSIKTAFILASSTNPKEHIQRRGRVLRKSSNKRFAEIYDFVVLPRSLVQAKNLTDLEQKYDISLIKRELSRVNEFGRLSTNQSESDILIGAVLDAYRSIKRIDLVKTMEDDEYE